MVWATTITRSSSHTKQIVSYGTNSAVCSDAGQQTNQANVEGLTKCDAICLSYIYRKKNWGEKNLKQLPGSRTCIRLVFYSQAPSIPAEAFLGRRRLHGAMHTMRAFYLPQTLHEQLRRWLQRPLSSSKTGIQRHVFKRHSRKRAKQHSRNMARKSTTRDISWVCKVFQAKYAPIHLDSSPIEEWSSHTEDAAVVAVGFFFFLFGLR